MKQQFHSHQVVKINSALRHLWAFQMSTLPFQAASPFGWVKDEYGDSSCVPIVDFDYDSVFKRMDGEVSDEPPSPKRPSLSEVLSPGELQHALAVSRNILKRSSHEYKKRCATWRNPEIRARRIAGMRRAWKYRDHQIPRKLALKLWRERRSDMISSINAANHQLVAPAERGRERQQLMVRQPQHPVSARDIFLQVGLKVITLHRQ